MKRSKFDDQFRKEFLANVRPPEGSFEFYENVLDFNRKKPFYKRNSFVKNLLALCIFIFVVLLTNIVTFTCTINANFYANNYKEVLMDYLSDEYNVVHHYEIITTNIDQKKVSIYLLKMFDSKYSIMYNINSGLDNFEVTANIDDKDLIFESFIIDNNGMTDSPFYISDSFILNNNTLNFKIIDEDTDEILVNFSKNLSLQ